MLKSSRLISLLLVLLILLTGCSAGELNEITQGNNQEIDENLEITDPAPDKESPVDMPPRNDLTKSVGTPYRAEVTSPVALSYIVPNPLETIQSSGININNTYDYTITIGGLKDEEVEARINGILRDTYAEMKSEALPPYRGIKVAIPKDSEVLHSSLDAHVTYSYNNVLSIQVSSSKTYKLPMQDAEMPGYRHNEQYVSRIKALNFDLNTGEEIKLKDVFADNVDYISILNDYISRQIMKGSATDEGYAYFYDYTGFKLVAPFKGIDDNQSFILHNTGITLIFDFNNPEFDNNFNPSTMFIGFYELMDSLAITNRFYHEEDLFTSTKARSKEFLPLNPRDIESIGNTTKINDTHINTQISYPSNSPESLVKIIMLLSDYYKDYIDQLNNEEEGYYISHSLDVQLAGTYTNITNNLYLHTDTMYESISHIYCYDEGMNLIKINNLFKEGSNHESVIRDGLRNAMAGYGLGIWDNTLVDELYQDLQFRIENSYLSFATKPVTVRQDSYQSIYFSISFDKFGDSLLIFD